MGFNYNDKETRRGRAGHLYDTGRGRDIISRNVGKGTKQVSTIVVDTSADDTAYAWTIAGIAQTITSAAAATKITIAQQIQDAINANPTLFGQLYALTDGVDTVTITARQINSAFALTDSDGNLTTATTTSASAGSNVKPGVVLMEESGREGLHGGCSLPSSSTAVAKVVDLTPEYSAGDELAIAVTVLGVTYPVIVTMATDLATTLDALVEALNEALPASTVLVEDGATKITLTSEVAGQDFEVAATVTDIGGASTPVTNTVVTANVTAAFSEDILGVAWLDQKSLQLPVAGSSSSLVEYEPGDVLGIVRTGRVDVLLDSGETVSPGDPVYVRTTAGATEELGACRNDSDSGDSLLWSRAKFISENSTGLDGQNIATIQIYDSAA